MNRNRVSDQSFEELAQGAARGRQRILTQEEAPTRRPQSGAVETLFTRTPRCFEKAIPGGGVNNSSTHAMLTCEIAFLTG